MNIAISQLNFKIADFERNSSKIIEQINSAQSQGAKLIVFPELAIGGTPAYDFLKSTKFLASVDNSIQQILLQCSEIDCILGAPYFESTTKSLYNAALFIKGGRVHSIIKKRALRDSSDLLETAYFEAGEGEQTIESHGQKITVSIGDDLQSIQAPRSSDIVVSLNNQPFSYTEYTHRLKRIASLSEEYQLPIIDVNQVGAQGSLIFDGRSIIMNKGGNFVDELNAFEEDLRLYQFEEQKLTRLKTDENIVELTEPVLIYKALVFGIREYFAKSGFKKALIGLSGGLDSALVAALATAALGSENIKGVLMPSMYSTDHSVRDAEDLARNLRCSYEIVPIKEGFDMFVNMLAPIFKGAPEDVTEQNIQARIRAVILMAISNKQGYIVLNTSNKSEAAMGYGTLYGDLIGSLSVLGDVYKTQVIQIANYINRDKEIIPNHTIIKPPSAELSPGQKDSDSLPLYEVLDPILFLLIEKGLSLQEVVDLGFDKDEVERITSIMSKVGFKLFQTPPALRVSPRPFGSGLKMPLVAKFS